MKTISAGLRTHLDGNVTTLATCWQITRRDGTVFRYTDHDADLTVSGDTYSALGGYTRTAIANEASFAVPNLDVQGYLAAGQILRADVEAGLWNRAEVLIFAVNYESTADGPLKLRRGWFGEITATPRGAFKVELRGLQQALSQRIVELTSPICRADLGDTRCKVPIDPDLRANSTAYALGDYVKVATAGSPSGTYADYEDTIYECTTAGTSDSSAPTFDTTPGNTTSDGTVVWTAREAWTRTATVASVTDRLNFTISVTESRAVDDWFNYGSVIWEASVSDNPVGTVREVKDWTQSGSAVELFAAAPFLPSVGDELRIYRGCDGLRATCKDVFDNVANMRAEPDLTGNDYLLGQRGLGTLA